MNSDVIYIDHSTISTFASCQEKARLAYKLHLRPVREPTPLIFGSAFHAAVAAFYTAIFEGQPRSSALEVAREAFFQDARKHSVSLPIDADAARRSVERGLNILYAYEEKWRQQDSHWTDLTTYQNKPYIEIGFAVHLMTWRDTPVVLVGKIDRIRRNRLDGRNYVFETKTTTSNTKYFADTVRPNHQLTTYVWACRELGLPEVAGVVLDAVYVSDRKVGGKFPTGVDIENDFGRFETRRSDVDMTELLLDLKMIINEYLDKYHSDLRRWYRNTSMCHMYGGCHFRKICSTNLNQSVIDSEYLLEKWEPWSIREQVRIVLEGGQT